MTATAPAAFAHLFRDFHRVVLTALTELEAAGSLPPGLDHSRVTIEPPRDPSHGELSTNAAMILAKAARQPPRALAEALCARLAEHPAVESATLAGPGFVNLRLKAAVWREQVRVILAAGMAYGDSALGKGRKVNVEFVSANPTGPLHAAHGRGAVFGDALAALLQKAGYTVTREYYINDAGAQVETLARSTHLRYREALGEAIGPIPAGYYPGDYLKEIGEALARQDGARWQEAPQAEWLPAMRNFAVAALMTGIRADLEALGVRMDVFASERALVESDAVDTALATLTARGLIYEGVLEPPKGKVLDDWEPRPQTLFRATGFGDDVDRPLKKSDGAYTYFANDIAYHYDKFCRGFTDLIDVWGADHGGYIKRMQAATAAITDSQARLDVKICQLVHLMDNGQPVKMSKRAGTFVTLRDVIEAVGKDVVRFIMLTRRNDQTLEFDFARVTEQSKDNPVFYVQYAHARCCSVLRHAAQTAQAAGAPPPTAATLATASLDPLDDPEELAIIRLMAHWPRVVESAAEAHEPHRIAFYLHDLASAFHGLWNRGKDDATLRFLVESAPALTAARLALVQAVALVLASGLTVMGVEPVEELRA